MYIEIDFETLLYIVFWSLIIYQLSYRLIETDQYRSCDRHTRSSGCRWPQPDPALWRTHHCSSRPCRWRMFYYGSLGTSASRCCMALERIFCVMMSLNLSSSSIPKCNIVNTARVCPSCRVQRTMCPGVSKTKMGHIEKTFKNMTYQSYNDWIKQLFWNFEDKFIGWFLAIFQSCYFSIIFLPT